MGRMLLGLLFLATATIVGQAMFEGIPVAEVSPRMQQSLDVPPVEFLAVVRSHRLVKDYCEKLALRVAETAQDVEAIFLAESIASMDLAYFDPAGEIYTLAAGDSKTTTKFVVVLPGEGPPVWQEEEDMVAYDSKKDLILVKTCNVEEEMDFGGRLLMAARDAAVPPEAEERTSKYLNARETQQFGNRLAQKLLQQRNAQNSPDSRQ